MRSLLILFSFIFLFSSYVNLCFAAKNDNIKEQELMSEIKVLRNDILIANQSIQELRRDQINYSIEKGLLKEAYSSNIQTINIVITIILAVFTVLGFLGVKSIDSIRKDFRNELDELKGLKIKYETNFEEIDKNIKSSMETLNEIKDVNKDKSERLRLLELQEKVATLIKNKSYKRALEYISAGLLVHNSDIVLLTQKASCLMKLGKFHEAINVTNILHELEPTTEGYISNLMELHLLLKQPTEYDNLIKKYADLILSNNPKIIIWYFESLKLYINGDVQSLKNHIINLKIDDENEKTSRIKGWGFYEASLALKADNDCEAKTIISNILKFLSGSLSFSELKATI